MKHIFDQGKSIIITGAEGVGKTSLAKAIADSLGTPVVTLQMRDMFSAYNSPWALADTVVVEEVPGGPAVGDFIRNLTSQETVVVNWKGEDSITAKMPNFIFVTGSKDFLPPGLEGRRFLAINMS